MILTRTHDLKISFIHGIWKINRQGTTDHSSAMSLTVDSRPVKLAPTQIEGGKLFHVFGNILQFRFVVFCHSCFPLFFWSEQTSLRGTWETLTNQNKLRTKNKKL
jgi:hypothetical protein